MPTSAFNIVRVEPPGFPYAGVFHDLARLLQLSLASLGHSVNVSVNGFDPGRINIVLNYQTLPDATALRGLRWIPYQLEQLAAHEQTLTPHWLQLLSHAPEIWDFDPGNVAYLQSRGLGPVKLVPLGFHAGLKTIKSIPPGDREIDVLFYGTLGMRREPILTAVSKRCRLATVFGVYGPVRDELIRRSRIILNIHNYDAAMFEQLRISYLLNNGCCVVSESSPYNPYAQALPTFEFGQLVDRCLTLVVDEPQRERFAADAARRFEELPMTQFLSHAID
jgi:hypothetical protein